MSHMVLVMMAAAFVEDEPERVPGCWRQEGKHHYSEMAGNPLPRLQMLKYHEEYQFIDPIICWDRLHFLNFKALRKVRSLSMFSNFHRSSREAK